MRKSKLCTVVGEQGGLVQGVGQAHSERGERGQARTDGRVSDISERSLDLTLEAGAMQRSNRPISFGKKRAKRSCLCCPYSRGCRLRGNCE